MGIEIMGIVAGVLAVTGCLLNNRRLRWCFLVWFVSNLITAVIHFDVGVWSLLARDLIFMTLAAEGWIRWGKKPIEGS